MHLVKHLTLLQHVICTSSTFLVSPPLILRLRWISKGPPHGNLEALLNEMFLQVHVHHGASRCKELQTNMLV